ncbi:MAG: O-antigen ligase family protein, partial [Chitinophagales bacterium]|nr:O-antigen ligase family protein [Chitinophagales bacterium]
YEQYKIATHIYNENELIGVGLGDVQLILMDSFSRREDLMYWHGLQKLNTHSQYLQYLLSGGIVGLAFFLIFISFVFYIGIIHRNYSLLIVFFIFIVNCLFENMLSRAWGVYLLNLILFISLPQSIEYFIKYKKNEKSFNNGG